MISKNSIDKISFKIMLCATRLRIEIAVIKLFNEFSHSCFTSFDYIVARRDSFCECVKSKLADLIDFHFVKHYNKCVDYAKFEQLCLMVRRENQ